MMFDSIRKILGCFILGMFLLLAGCGKSTEMTAAGPNFTPDAECTPMLEKSSAEDIPEADPKDTSAAETPSVDESSPLAESTPADESTSTAQSFPAAPAYKVVYDLKITHVSSYEGFLNESFGLTVGTDGETHYTNDGGKTWPEAHIESHCRFGLDIVNENIAWSCGNHWHIRLTTDGGKTWSKVSDFGTVFTQGHISFIDDKTGWVASSIDLGATADGGQTWTKLALPQGLKGIAAIDRRSEQVGYLLATDGVLYTTSATGSTWQQKGGLPLLELNISDMKGNAGTLHVGQMPNVDMSFVDEQNGILIAIGFIDKQGFKVFRFETSDGGNTWTQLALELPEGYHPNTVFLSKDGQYMNFSDNKKRVLVLKREP